MQGLVMCARFLFSPYEEGDMLYSYVVTKKDDERIKAFVKRCSIYTMLRLISSKNEREAFDPKVVEAYWIGNDLLEQVGSDELGLLLKNYSFTPSVDRLIFGMLQVTKEERLAPHHSVFVLLNATNAPHAPVEKVNDSLLTWGKVIAVYAEALTVQRVRLTKPGGYVLEEQEETVSYDPAFVGQVHIGDHIAIHHQMAICPLSLLQLAYLKRYTERTLSVFSRFR